MTKSAADAVTRREAQLPARFESMRNSKQKDDSDDCVSEDSFGSDFDNATGEDLNASLDGADTELNSPPPYSEEEPSQSTSLVKSPSTVLRYTPTGPTELEPAFNATPNISMCVVRGLIFNPTLISINLHVRSARFLPPIAKMELPIRPAGHLSVLAKCERFLVIP